MNVPLEVVAIILDWVNEFKDIDEKTRIINFSYVLDEIMLLPIERECGNCSNISKNRYFCCNYFCEYCEIRCSLCNTTGCVNCVDVVDSCECWKCHI